MTYARMKSFPKKEGSSAKDIADGLSALLIVIKDPAREKATKTVIRLIRSGKNKAALRELKKWEKNNPSWLGGLPGDFARALGEEKSRGLGSLLEDLQGALSGGRRT